MTCREGNAYRLLMNDKSDTAIESAKHEWMDPNDPHAQDEKPAKPPFYKRPLVAGAIIVAVIALVIGGVLLWIHSRKYESTDDAYLDATSQQVSPRIAGRVSRIFVEDNQEVAADTVVAELDPADLQSQVDQALAAVAQARAQVAQAGAQKSVFASQVDQAQANLGVAQANADNARSELQRFQSLREASAGAVSQEQLERAIAADKSASAQVAAAQQAVSAAQAQVRYADSMETAAAATANAAQSKLEQARLTLSYTHVRAAIAGRVARKEVALGNEVQPGTPLMAIVPRDVFVTANFKETQLAKMKVGQRVDLQVDAYPDQKLQGHVQSFQSGTGQAFSGLPAENATGNWVKVVQRLPVKIVIDQLPNDPARPLGPGMSVEVKVHLQD